MRPTWPRSIRRARRAIPIIRRSPDNRPPAPTAGERPVIPWSLLDTAQVPGGGELRLLQRGAEFSIKLGTQELMNSRLSATEQALATIACEKIRIRKQPSKEL